MGGTISSVGCGFLEKILIYYVQTALANAWAVFLSEKIKSNRKNSVANKWFIILLNNADCNFDKQGNDDNKR